MAASPSCNGSATSKRSGWSIHTTMDSASVARPPWKLYDGTVDKMKATTIRRSSGLSRSFPFVRCLNTSQTIATFAMLSSERHIPGASRSRKSASSTGPLRIASSFSLTPLSKTSTIGSATQVACFLPLAGGYTRPPEFRPSTGCAD
jgi:hypothetical protein